MGGDHGLRQSASTILHSHLARLPISVIRVNLRSAQLTTPVVYDLIHSGIHLFLGYAGHSIDNYHEHI